MTRAVLLAILMALVGCGHAARTTRLANDRVLEGRFIDEDAYAAFLEGVVAEETGDLPRARAGYERALRMDGPDPGILSRRAEIWCRQGDQAAAARDVEKALALDPGYAPAFHARAYCADVRHDEPSRAHASELARSLDPSNVAYNTVGATSARDAGHVLAATLAFGDRPAAWDAMLQWAWRHNDPSGVAEAATKLARLVPARRAELGRWVKELSDVGEADLAGDLALDLLFVEGPRVPELVGKLGVDRAIRKGGAALARKARVRAHLPVSEVAARAWLLHEHGVARELVEAAVEADPADAALHAVHLVVEGKWRAFRGSPAKLPAAVWIALAREIAVRSGIVACGAFVAEVSREAIDEDPLLVPLAVDLALRGAAIPLPSSGQVELAARAGAVPTFRPSALGDRHRLLYLSLFPEAAPELGVLAARLEAASGRDPVVTAGLLGAATRRAAPMTGPWRQAARFALDPLVLAAISAHAARMGEHDVAALAGARLGALAVTDRERLIAAP